MNHNIAPFPRRPRIPGYDYSSPGAYFVTFITEFRECILSDVVEYSVVLTALGEIVDQNVQELSQRFPTITILCYCIMPNHVHLLFEFGDGPDRPQLSRVVNVLKSKSTVEGNRLSGRSGPMWQRSYRDTVIRSEPHLFQVVEYIENNPGQWQVDRLNPFRLHDELEIEAAASQAMRP